MELWAQDEHRSGLKAVLRRVWAGRRERPTASAEHGYEWTYVYGFVRPMTGETWWLLLPRVNTAVMSLALAEFAAAHGIGPQKRVVLLWDRAGWHTSGRLEVPEGLHLVELPPYSPELQPAERLWPLCREAVANRSHGTIEALEDKLAERCRSLSAAPEQVKGLCDYHWWPGDLEVSPSA